MAITFVLLWHWREIIRGVSTWRKNGFVVLLVAAFLSMSVILSALGNFGLLARQRTQVLPFLFMLPCMVQALPRGRRAREAAQDEANARARRSRAALPA